MATQFRTYELAAMATKATQILIDKLATMATMAKKPLSETPKKSLLFQLKMYILLKPIFHGGGALVARTY